jgi:beta-lactamase regulating signal transducer with metallopeptidase domain
MEWMIEQVNTMGEVFVGLALPMFLSSALLIALVLSVEFFLRTRVRAALRYWLVVSVLAYLLLIPFLSLCPPSTHWPTGAAAYADPTYSAPASQNAPLSRPITGPSQTTVAGVGERPPRLTWQGTVFVLWLAGVLVAGGLFVQRAATAFRRVDGSPTANLLMKDILAYCRKRMRIRGTVQLKVSEDGTQPVVCGLVRPVIVVPRTLAPSLGSRHLRDVLFHELAHVKRCDLWVHLVQNFVQVLYFYNPLLLLVHAALRRLRDEAADEAVRDALGGADHAYTQRLAEVATLALKPPTSGLSVISVA